MSGGQSPDHGSANAEFNQPFSDEQSVPIEVEPPEGPSGAPVNCFLECLAFDALFSVLHSFWCMAWWMSTMYHMLRMGPAGEGEVSSQHRIEVAQDRQSSDVQWPRMPLSALDPLNVKREPTCNSTVCFVRARR